MRQKIMPPTYFFALLLLSIALHFILPVRQLIDLPYRYLGIVLIAFGAVVNVWTDSLFKSNKTTVKPHENPTELITSGPFRLSRHPMYLGMTAVLSGVAILDIIRLTNYLYLPDCICDFDGAAIYSTRRKGSPAGVRRRIC